MCDEYYSNLLSQYLLCIPILNWLHALFAIFLILYNRNLYASQLDFQCNCFFPA